MNGLKEKIMSDLYEERIEDISDKIELYLRDYPADTDILSIKGFIEINNNNFGNAIDILQSIEKRKPYDADINFLLGTAYLGVEAVKAIWYLTCSKFLASYFNYTYMFYNEEEYDVKMSEAENELAKIIDEAERIGDREKLKSIKNEIDYIQFYLGKELFLFKDILRSVDKVIGESYYTTIGDKRVFGFHNPIDYSRYGEYRNIPLTMSTGEMIKEEYRGKEYIANVKDTTLLPIMTVDNNNIICFKGDEEVYCNQVSPNHFNYYRLNQKTNIYAQNEMIIGNPIQLKYDSTKKKLIISLFVDGLSQRVLEEEGIENVMPYTYEFFSKGMICKNMFTTSDWTYPTIASTISGLELTDHMMVHPKINRKVSEIKILFEYLQEAGYYTALISGDWRISSTYGYDRGIDRYIAGHQCYLMHAEQVVSNAIEHISAFDETNQYVWMSIGDLHDIADGFDTKTAVQTKTEIQDRKIEEKTLTSIKQFYSEQKRKAYIKTARQVDLHLKALYDYIEEHYKDEEFVVTIFGDHGQTYLNRPEEHHLAKGHTNVGFMVRGGVCKGESNEYMSLLSYPNILCKLAGVDEIPEGMKGKLPVVFGGEDKAEFVLAETIHPGDKYMAAIYSEEYEFYFTTDNVMDEDVKIEIDGYTAELYDHKGNLQKNETIVKKYIEYLLNHIRYIISY